MKLMNKVIVIGITVLVLIVGGYLALPTIYKWYFSNNPNGCEGQGSYRDVCYFGSAQNKKDPNLCDKINLVSGDAKSNSKDLCYQSLASELSKPELCTKITKISGEVSRDGCYLNLASKLRDTEFCNKVSGEKSEYQGNPLIIDKDFCIQYVATETNQPELCEKVSLKTYREDKINIESCYFFVATTKKDPTFCNKLTVLKNKCIQEIKK